MAGWTIPDKGEGQSDAQSIAFQEYLEVLVAGLNGIDCVLAGCGCAPQGTPDMTVAVAKGAVLTNGVLKPVTAGNVTIGTADATNPRIDLIVVNSSGTKAVRAGTAAAAPKPPTRSANDVVLAAVWVPASDTTISADQITDMRVLRTQGPICIYKTTAAETTNTTAAAVHILDKTNSGVVIPNGLFLAGRILRVSIWGNVLLNNTTPTLLLSIAYGGTTMFADTSAASANDADRRPFRLDFTLTAQGNSDQALNGQLWISDFSTGITAPATGLGDAWPVAASKEGDAVIAGSAAVDSDAADRTLTCTLTMSVSNASNEIVVEGATVEIL